MCYMYQAARHYLRCSSCGEDHAADEIKVEDIEEDLHGRDVLTYRCPATGVIVKAHPLIGYA